MVTDKPEFINDLQSIIDLTEGLSGLINITARANPPNIIYNWYKNDQLMDSNSNRISKNGSILNFTNVTRKDAAEYSLEASNSQGTTRINFKVNVNCE